VPTSNPLVWQLGGGGGGGITAVNGGTGITATTTGGVATVSNSGVLAVSAGTGITANTVAGTTTVANSGVLAVTAGTGITASTVSGTTTVANSGILAVTGGTGIGTSTTGGTTTVNNNGVLSVASGSSNVTIGGTSQNPTISVTGGGGETGYTYIYADGGSQSGTISVNYAVVGATDPTKRYLVYYSVIGASTGPDLTVYVNPNLNPQSHFIVMNSAPSGGNNINVAVQFGFPIPSSSIQPFNGCQYQLNPCASLDISYSNLANDNILIIPYRTVPNL